MVCQALHNAHTCLCMRLLLPLERNTKNPSNHTPGAGFMTVGRATLGLELWLERQSFDSEIRRVYVHFGS